MEHETVIRMGEGTRKSDAVKGAKKAKSRGAEKIGRGKLAEQSRWPRWCTYMAWPALETPVREELPKSFSLA